MQRSVHQLQATAGNRAVQRAMAPRPDPTIDAGDAGGDRPGSGVGRGLPTSAQGASRILGSLARDVTLDTEVTMPRRSILAATEGTTISLAPNAPAPESTAGQFLLAHEAAHVVQQQAGGPAGTQATAEADADRAAVGAISGGPLPALGAADGPLYFEAGLHQASLTGAMNAAGFTDAEQMRAYKANWTRDVSQAFVPIVADTVGMNAAMTILQIMSQAKFGESVTPDMMGMYDPVDHIDAPAGQTNADFIQHTTGSATVELPGRGTMETPVADYSSENIASMYEVDDSGVPEYINMSKERIKTLAGEAVDVGRGEQGLERVGRFSHTVEDLFAHSNWIEAAVGALIQDDSITLEGEAAAEVQQRMDVGDPPVETFASQAVSAAGAMRPMLMTGTFSGGSAGHDTLISIKAEATNLIHSANPFGGEPSDKYWDLALEVLEHVEAAGTEETLGPIMLAHVDEILANVDRAVGGIGNQVTEATAGLADQAASMDEGWTRDVAVFGTGLLNQGAESAVEGIASIPDNWKATIRSAVVEIINTIGANVDLAAMLIYAKKGKGDLADAWDSIKDAVNDLPDVPEAFFGAVKRFLVPELAAAEKQFKKAVEDIVQAAWNKATNALLDSLEDMASKVDIAESNVGQKMEANKAELYTMRDALADNIREVAPGALGESFIATMYLYELEDSEQRLAFVNYLAGGNLSETLADVARTEVASIQQQINTIAETDERIRQIEALPDWAQAGPSHSQIAKDHADSPFFGAAFTMSAAADLKLMQAMRAAWEEAGFTGPVEQFDRNFDEPETSFNPLDLILDSNAVDEERRTSFLETRERGERIVAEGHEDQRPLADLASAGSALLNVRRQEPLSGPFVDPLISLLRRGATTGRIIAEVERVHHWLESGDADRLLTKPLRDDPGVTVGAALRPIVASVLSMLGFGEDEHEGHDHPEHPDHHHQEGERNEVFYEHQIESLRQSRTRQRNEAQDAAQASLPDERPGSEPTDRDRAVEEAASAREGLMAEIDRIFAHPYDSNWWRPTLIGWCTAHSQLLADYIIERNSGRAHHH